MEKCTPKATIKVVGVGDTGLEVIDLLVAHGIEELELIHIYAKAHRRTPQYENSVSSIALEEVSVTDATDTYKSERMSISNLLDDSDMVFVVAGMDDEASSRGAVLTAQISKAFGILTAAILSASATVDKDQQSTSVNDNVRELHRIVNTIFPLPISPGVHRDIFDLIRSIVGHIFHGGIVSSDFTEIRNVLAQLGQGVIGAGISSGQRRGTLAAQAAMNDAFIRSNTSQRPNPRLVTITGNRNVSLRDYIEVGEVIDEHCYGDEVLILGVACDDTMNDLLRVFVLAEQKLDALHQ